MNDDDKKQFQQIITESLVNFWESVSPTIASKKDLEEIRAEMATKSDLQKLENKVDGLEHKVDLLSRDVKEIRRRVIDLETDTPTRSEFDRLKIKVNDLSN